MVSLLSAFGAMLSQDSRTRPKPLTPLLGLLGSQAHAFMEYFINDSPLYHSQATPLFFFLI